MPRMALVGHHQIPDALDELMGGRRAQQGVRACPCAALMPDQRIKAATSTPHQPSIFRPGETAHQRGDQHRGGGHAVAEGVHGGGLHGGRGQLLPQPPVVEEHIQLHQQWTRTRIAKISGLESTGSGCRIFSMDDLAQLQAHQQDQRPIPPGRRRTPSARGRRGVRSPASAPPAETPPVSRRRTRRPTGC